MDDSLVHHYPPELMDLLINAIPRLIKGKRDLIAFFKGCGVPDTDLAELSNQVRINKAVISKYEIARQVLVRLNDKGDTGLRARREVLRRVTQWENFDTCYESDRMQAMGYVAEIRRIVDVKDSFTRMNQEREAAEREARRSRETNVAAQLRLKQEREAIRSDLNGLFLEKNAVKRGLALESVLNRLFKSHGILIRESFRRLGNDNEGVVEQIDGVVELDGSIYLVEMKWWSKPLGTAEVSQHLVRVFGRNAARGFLLSQSGYTDPAVAVCRESLSQKVFVLGHLSEIVFLLEGDHCLKDLIREKARAAIVDKNPLTQIEF